MHSRRDFLTRTIGGSSLLAVGSIVPEFLASTALAADKAEKGKDTVLVVIELTGGNDGLNIVAPYADDLYQKARPTLAFGKKEVLKLDDYCGLHPRMNDMKRLFDEKKLAVVQGIGYPNPDRSHFESMDIWQLADPEARPDQRLAGPIDSRSVGEGRGCSWHVYRRRSTAGCHAGSRWRGHQSCRPRQLQAATLRQREEPQKSHRRPQ